MKQHYKVGELVVICAYNRTENGQIHEVMDINVEKNDIGYKLNTNTVEHVARYENYWSQEVLKKFYPPSTQTFAEIIEVLKQPVTNAR